VTQSPPSSFLIENLENRRLLSHGHGGGGHLISTIEFDQAPAAVQSGLNDLATADNLSAPTATQTVYLGNSNGVETYSMRMTGTGTVTQITVDVAGNPVTAPTKSSTTFDSVGNAAVTDEFNAIATALGATAPAASDKVSVTTPSGGTAVYTMRLVTTTTSGHSRGISVSVDANGNPVGNAQLPFSAIPAAIQTALNTNAPSGATPLATDATDKVSVRTANGVTTYTVKFTASGTTSSVTVNAAGVLTNLPGTSSTTFSTIPIEAQTELQTLATADGVSAAIATDAPVRAYDEANGTTIYSITLAAADSSGTGTHNITLSVDQNGNPTVPPTGGFFANVLYGGTCFGGGRSFGQMFGGGMFQSFGRRGRH
jgi:hypothetical protein